MNPITPTSADPGAGGPAPLLVPRDRRYGAERALWTLVGIGLLWSSWRLINFTAAPWTVPFMVAGNIWGVGTVLASWVPDLDLNGDGRLVSLFQWGAGVMMVTLLVVSGIAQADVLRQYGTDALAFNQYAGMLARHGANPYVHSLARAYGMFDVRPRDYTYTFAGAHVTALSYPALSFLVYVPFLALGWVTNLAPLLNVCAWGLTAVMMFVLSPRQLRPVVLLFSGFGIYAVFAGGGVTDVLFMPLLTVAAYRWDRFGAGRWTYAGPLAFGLAMAIKQTPWPVLPFLLIALALDQGRLTGLPSGLKRAGRYLTAVLVAFAIPNLPYFIASPHAWVSGVLTPLHSLVPTGLGTIALSIYVHMGGGSMTAFTIATGLMFALALVVFVGTYPLLRSSCWMLPALPFLFASRSNLNYFAALIPAGYVAVTSIVPAPPRRWFRSSRWTLAYSGLALGFLVAAVYSITAPPPLRIRLTALRTAGRSSHINQLTIRVSNRSGAEARPVFAVLQTGPNTSFWKVVSGPARLARGQVADYTLLTHDPSSEPSLKDSFTVLGFLASPESFAVSNEYDAALYHGAARRRLSGSHSLEVRFGGG